MWGGLNNNAGNYGFPQTIGKTFDGVFLLFIPLTSADWFKKEDQVATYYIGNIKYELFSCQNVFAWS